MIAPTSNVWIEKSRLLRISDLATPLIAGSVAINLTSFADTLMVGQLGNAALAGVGLGGQLFFLLLAVSLGIAAGVQAIVARRVGEGRQKATGHVLNAGIVLAFLVGLGLIAIGYVVLPPVFELVLEDAQVVAQGLTYLDYRLPGLLFIGVNIAFRAYWAGVSLAKLSMISVLALSVANVVFNYLLIFGNFGFPEMGVAGAGLGSTLALLLGLVINIGFGLKHARLNGFLGGFPDQEVFRKVVQISYPDSIRQVLFSVGVVALYALIGQIGTIELAAFHVIISICLIAYMPHIGMGGAATTLVGEALGRKDTKDADRWGWQVSTVGLVVLSVLGLAVALFAEIILQWFRLDAATLAVAVVPLQLAVFAHVFDGYGKVIGSALIGAGATATAMRLTLLPLWLLTLPLIGLAVFMGYGLLVSMVLFLGAAIVAALLFVVSWHRQRWASIEI